MTTQKPKPTQEAMLTRATPFAVQNSDPAPIHAALQHFDKLPDSAEARLPVVSALFGISDPTTWRWSRDGKLPKPTKRGGVTTWNVGALRRAKAQAEVERDTRTAAATAAATAKRNTAPAA